MASTITKFYVPRLTADKSILGFISLNINQQANNQELSYLFFPKFWGHGYASETVAALIANAFDTQNIPRIFAETQSNNTRSMRLLHAIGMKKTQTVIRYGAEQSIFTIDNPTPK